MEDLEYLALKKKVEEARKSAHLTELWQTQKTADEAAEQAYEYKKY